MSQIAKVETLQAEFCVNLFLHCVCVSVCVHAHFLNFWYNSGFQAHLVPSLSQPWNHLI